MAAAPNEAKEHEVKAAFLYNFAKYTTWPADAFAREDSPFVLAVFGADPFGTALDATMKDKKVGTHPVQVVRYARVADIATPHLLFIAEAGADGVAEVLAKVREKPVLVAGDAAGFASAGGTFGFFLDDKKVRFEANPAAAKRAGLQVAAQLLKLARIVEEK